MRRIALLCLLALALTTGAAGAAELMPDVGGPRDNLLVDYAYYAFPTWQTADGWDQASRFSTIQAADLDGDGKDEILGRSDSGLEVWSVDTDTGVAQYLATLDYMSDAGNWGNAWYYETIQAGDINGDGKDEVIARGSDGIKAWRYVGGATPFSALADGPAWSNDAGWKDPAYYESIGLADLDGDGAKEVAARSVHGLVAFKYSAANNSWSALATLDALADDGVINKNAAYYQSIRYGNILGPGGNGDQVTMITPGGGMSVYSYNPSSNSWTTYQDNSSYFSDIGKWTDGGYANSIQLYDSYGNGIMHLAARSSDGLGLYRFMGDGWNLDETLDAFSNANGWNHGDYARTIHLADVDGDGLADAMGWNGDGVTGCLAADGWTALTNLELSTAKGWNQKQFSSTIRFANLDGDATNGNEMLIRGSSGVRLYGYSASSGGLADFRRDYPEYTTGDQAAAYDYILAGLRAFGLLNPNYDLRQTYGSITTSDWSSYAAVINNMTKPDAINQTDWDAVTSELNSELLILGHIQGPYYDARSDFFQSVFDECNLLISDVENKVRLSQDFDNKYASVAISSLIQSMSKMVMGVLGPEAGIVTKGLWTMFVTTTTNVVTNQMNPSVTPNPNLSTDVALFAQVSALQDQLLDWFNGNLDRYNDFYADMVSTQGGLTRANQVRTDASADFADIYDQARQSVVDQYTTYLYKALMPVEYRIRWDYSTKSDKIDHQVYPFHADPPDYAEYRDTDKVNGEYKWNWIEKSAGTYPIEDLLDTIWGLGVSEDDFYHGHDGWNFSISQGT